MRSLAVCRYTAIIGTTDFYCTFGKLLHSLKLPGHGQGGQKFNDLLSDDKKKMEKVFEAFLRNFYKVKQRVFGRVQSEHLKWNTEAASGQNLEMLPVMITDVTLRNAHRTIVLDAKYYKDALQEHYGAKKAHSEHLYQLLAYLRAENAGEGLIIPEGILVYPTGESNVNASFVIDRYPVPTHQPQSKLASHRERPSRTCRLLKSRAECEVGLV